MYVYSRFSNCPHLSIFIFLFFNMKNELLLFRFDTHYPDYFPPRSNFKAVVAALQSMGVAVFPYINGRIFDVASDSYIRDDGAKSCSKYPNQVYDGTKLNLYQESYGSGATFNVADPTTTYWQNTIASTFNWTPHCIDM